MPVVKVVNDEFIEMNDKMPIIGEKGVQHPWNIISNWADEDLAKLGIYRVAVASPPKGKQIKPGTAPQYKWGKDKKVEQVIEVEAIPVVTGPKLDDIKTKALQIIDEKVFNINPTVLYIHDQKYQEAKVFLADHARPPDMSQYPYLSAALVTKTDGKTATAIAKLWQKKAIEFREKIAAYEAKRLAARQMVHAAENAEKVQSVIDNFDK